MTTRRTPTQMAQDALDLPLLKAVEAEDVLVHRRHNRGAAPAAHGIIEMSGVTYAGCLSTSAATVRSGAADDCGCWSATPRNALNPSRRATRRGDGEPDGSPRTPGPERSS